MTKKQNLIPSELKLNYSDVIYKREYPDSSDYFLYIKSEHMSGGYRFSFSAAGNYIMEKRRQKINKNILFTLEDLTKYNLDLVGLESLELGDSSLEGKSRYPSEIPEKKLDSILRGTNYQLGFMIKETFGDKILTFGVSDTILNNKNRKINEEISKIEREFHDRGMIVYGGKEEHLVWNPNIEEEFLDMSACSLRVEYQHLYAKRDRIIEEREKLAIISLLKKMRKTKEKKKRRKCLAVLVMGAGHEENIKELLNQLEISYYVLEPKGYRYETSKSK